METEQKQVKNKDGYGRTKKVDTGKQGYMFVFLMVWYSFNQGVRRINRADSWGWRTR